MQRVAVSQLAIPVQWAMTCNEETDICDRLLETEYVKDGHLRTVAVVLLIALGRMLVNQAKDGVVEMEIAKVIWAKQQLFAR